MGKHVDTTRTEDDVFSYLPRADWERDILGYDWPRVWHRKPGGIRADDPHWGYGYNSVMYPDVWSGNPDTDRAWR